MTQCTDKFSNFLRVFFILGILIIASSILLREALAAEYEAGLEAVQKEDYKTALRKWKPLAEAGNSDAQFGLGYMYLQGKGVVLNYKRAMNWFRLAAEQGDPDAQNNLGLMYAVGSGVVEDPVYALMWFNLAASAGSEGAKKNIVASEEILSKFDQKEAKEMAMKCKEKKYKGC